MKNLNFLINIFNYNSWANDEFFKVIVQLSPDEINKRRKFFMNSIKNSLNHLLVTNKVCLADIKQEKHAFNNLQIILFDYMQEIWEA